MKEVDELNTKGTNLGVILGNVQNPGLKSFRTLSSIRDFTSYPFLNASYP